jgi:hypothetical protein
VKYAFIERHRRIWPKCVECPGACPAFNNIWREAGGNAGLWKKGKRLDRFPPFPPTLEIDRTDFHIPTVTITTTR